MDCLVKLDRLGLIAQCQQQCVTRVGLERRRSGNGPERLHVPKFCNRVLKSTILGAAKSAIVSVVRDEEPKKTEK